MTATLEHFARIAAEDWDAFDTAMTQERRTAVLIDSDRHQPWRLTGRESPAGHVTFRPAVSSFE